MKTLLTIIVLCLGVSAWAQTFTETIKREFTFEKPGANNALLIANISGSIDVQGYAGDKILVEVKKTIKAKTAERLETGKKELTVGVIDRADTIILFAEGGCNRFLKATTRRDNQRRRWNGWGYDWEGCNKQGWHDNDTYQFKLDFVVKVPVSIHVAVSTINDGDISIEGVNGDVFADNINGSIKMKNLRNKTYASTINGDVDLDYDVNPSEDCRYYTLNGDIRAMFKKGLAASMTFESFNGSFYTNIDEMETMPVVVEKNKAGSSTKYKVNGNRYKIGSGGTLLDFETFNGDVYLKEKTN